MKDNFSAFGSNRYIFEPSDITTGSSGRDISYESYSKFSDQQRLEFRLSRSFLLHLLGVSNLDDIPGLFGTQNKEELNEQIIERYGKMKGLENEDGDNLKGRVGKALADANSVISFFENPETGLFRQMNPFIGQTNEITSIINTKDSSLVDLIFIMFSKKSSRRLRYEARRMLMLADLAFDSNLHVESIGNDMNDLIRYFNTHIWEGGLGEGEKVPVLSYHSPENYACLDAHVMQDGERIEPNESIRYSEFKMRPWKDARGSSRRVFVEHRLKDPVSRVLKLLRKDTRDPAKIDDYLGFKFVFEDKNDIYLFLDMVQKSLSDNGSACLFSEVYDTIDNTGTFRVTNAGSSTKLEIVKVHAQIDGKLVEFQMHTFRTFLDSRYHDERGFEAYSIQRVFDSGVVDVLYPLDIYGVDFRAFKDRLLLDRQWNTRNAFSVIPLERLPDGISQIMNYPQSAFYKDITTIVESLDSIPDKILAIGSSGQVMAASISGMLGGIPVIDYAPEMDLIDDGSSVLVLNGILVDGRRPAIIKKKLPNAVVAVIGEKYPDRTKGLTDIVARTDITPTTWYKYFWEVPSLRQSVSQGIALFYRRLPEGEIEILVEKSKEYLKNPKRYKLIGGKKLPRKDKNLKETALREAREELGIEFDPAEFKPLSSLSYVFEPYRATQTHTHIRKGFAQAFACKVGQDFNPKVVENEETEQFEWMSPTKFLENAMWKSYIECLPSWLEDIATIESEK